VTLEYPIELVFVEIKAPIRLTIEFNPETSAPVHAERNESTLAPKIKTISLQLLRVAMFIASKRVSYCGLLAICLLVSSAPASGQEAAGRIAETPLRRQISATVVYRDLELTTPAGRNELRHRVWTTARKLCSRLGESEIGGVSAASSCEDAARINAVEMERVIIAQAFSPALQVARAPGTATH
jgi:UrcA family protein